MLKYCVLIRLNVTWMDEVIVMRKYAFFEATIDMDDIVIC